MKEEILDAGQEKNSIRDTTHLMTADVGNRGRKMNLRSMLMDMTIRGEASPSIPLEIIIDAKAISETERQHLQMQGLLFNRQWSEAASFAEASLESESPNASVLCMYALLLLEGKSEQVPRDYQRAIFVLEVASSIPDDGDKPVLGVAKAKGLLGCIHYQRRDREQVKWNT